MDISSTNYILAAAIRATVPAVTLRLSKASNLDDIPSNGYSSWSLSYISSFEYYLEDVKGSTDDELSLIEAANGVTWKSGLAVETVREIVADPATPRVFIDLPLHSTSSVNFCSVRHVSHPALRRELPNTAAGIAHAMKHLDPIIKERLRCNDILQWLIDENQESSTRQLTQRVSTINFASIHTFSRALYNLPAYPQYVGPLREEVDAIIGEHGWTKEAIALMRKAASFLIETQRLEGILTLMTVQVSSILSTSPN
ncbi:hypothetical protein BKA83DRAFT_4130286 [Pisolithus microcarpus]|nr:hypothetical protein BKA83DRAFT_4130286 [Pisolithus microcarpus]